MRHGDTHLPIISVSAAVCSPSSSDVSFVPSQDPYSKAKQLHASWKTCSHPAPAAESRDANPGRAGEQLLLLSHLPAGSRACCVLEVAIPDLPSAKELPRAPFLPSPLLCPCPPPAPPVRSAAAPARAPNALTTAVGLIIKITF